MTGIIDYGVGNLHSVSKALAALGVESRIVSDGRGFSRCDRLILPGVGAFPDAMEAIKPLEGDIRAAVRGGVPLMGICLGMQMLFEYSDECGGAKGLGILPGVVRRFPDGLIVPHMGWSPLYNMRGDLFRGIERMDAYVVHSFFCPTGDFTAARARHGDEGGIISVEFSAAVQQGRVMGTQFHPEKSGRLGLNLLKNFAMV